MNCCCVRLSFGGRGGVCAEAGRTGNILSKAHFADSSATANGFTWGWRTWNKIKGRMDEKVGWERIWLPLFFLSGSYNSCFLSFCKEVWEGAVRERPEPENVWWLPQQRSFLIRGAGLLCMDTSKLFFRNLALFRGLHGDWHGGWCLELSSADFPSPRPLWLLLVQGAVTSKGSQVPQMATHLWDQPANWYPVLISDSLLMEGSLICSHWDTHSPPPRTWICLLHLLHHLWDLLKIFYRAEIFLTGLSLTFTERDETTD